MTLTTAITLFIQQVVPVVQSTASAAAQSVQETATVVSMVDSISTLKAQVFLAYVTVFLLKIMRKSKYLPIMQENASRMNKFVSIGAAFLASQGVSYAFNIMTISEASRVLNITITFPTSVALMHTMWDWGMQYVFQQGWYKALVVSGENQAMISGQIAEAVGKPAGVTPPPPGVVTQP